MSQFIRVQPVPAQRVDFARWASAQNPKVRTVSPQAFAVPHRLFTDVPERLLIGALVDGHRYVSPEEDEMLGVFQPEREGIPGQPLPELPDDAYPPDAVPLPAPDYAPLEDAPVDEDEDSGSSDRASDSAGITCDVCDRPFKSERGRDTHRRQVHQEGSDAR
ncbi:hypothetical protein GCM10010250_22210 [Streptomyces althioticus]|uniref:hypothetical protein n=1 Tax=Streptomyces althioticus TaxID=83380 RepID=UPI001876E7AB|nr:hypothetical protein GCM10010250_22210 [Streptomyces althioticus]